MSHRMREPADDELNEGDEEWLQDFDERRAEDDERAAQFARTRRTWRRQDNGE